MYFLYKNYVFKWADSDGKISLQLASRILCRNYYDQKLPAMLTNDFAEVNALLDYTGKQN